MQEIDRDAGKLTASSDKVVKFERNPVTGKQEAEEKKSKRQLRQEAEFGQPVMIVVPRGGPRGLTRAEIRDGLDASRKAGHPTYVKWALE